MCTYADSTITVRPINAPRAVWQDGLHGAIRMLDSLRAIGVGDELWLGRGAVWVVSDLAWRCTTGSSMRRDIPLRYTSGELYEVVFLAGAVPLCDPARVEWWRRERGTLGARRCWPCHLSAMGGVCCAKEGASCLWE